jgi:hypothetical protein
MSVEHALSCKVGGLVHICHDNVAEEWAHLSELAFRRDELLTNHVLIHVRPVLRGEQGSKGMLQTQQLVEWRLQLGC